MSKVRKRTPRNSGKLLTNASKEDFKRACIKARGKLNPLLENKKEGQVASCRIPLEDGKDMHARINDDHTMSYETETSVSVDPIGHLLDEQIPNKRDFDKTLGKNLKGLGRKYCSINDNDD